MCLRCAPPSCSCITRKGTTERQQKRKERRGRGAARAKINTACVAVRPRSQCVGGMLLVQWGHKHVMSYRKERTCLNLKPALAPASSACSARNPR